MNIFIKEDTMTNPNKLQQDGPNLRNKWGTKLWYNCAIGFYWDGLDIADSDISDIHFPAGYYMWNDHTMLNWETMTPELDFVYLIQATGDRLKEDGTPHFPHLYRYCPNGVVVRKLSKLDEHGNERGSFRNYNDNAFILNVPGAVTIGGEEFHFISHKDGQTALKNWIAEWKREALKVVV